MRKMGLWVLVAIAILVGLVLPKSGNPPDDTSLPRQKLVLATSFSPLAGLVFVAHDQGFLADQGLDVTFNQYASGSVALRNMLQGNADIVTAAEYPVVNAVLDGEEPRILGTIVTSHKNLTVIARKDRGISLLKDLSGKKVGVAFGTSGEFFLEMLLVMNHLPVGAIEKINIDPGELVEAIATGRVDAISAFNPFAILARKRLGKNHTVFYGDTLFTETFNLITTEGYLARNSHVAEKVLRAVVRAALFIKEDPRKAQDSVAKFVKLDRVLLDEIWESYLYKLTMDQSLIVTMEAQARWVLERRGDEVNMLPNFFDVLHIEGVKAVLPDSITVIH